MEVIEDVLPFTGLGRSTYSVQPINERTGRFGISQAFPGCAGMQPPTVMEDADQLTAEADQVRCADECH
jgi:hypothetical protein